MVSAYYVPADDDELPDYYNIYLGEDASGDLEDVLELDDDVFHIESKSYFFRKERVEISFGFDYDVGPFDVFSVFVNVEITGCSSSTVDVWINGDVDGWFLLASVSSSVTSIVLAEEDQQGVYGIKFFKEMSGADDFDIDIDHAILNFTF